MTYIEPRPNLGAISNQHPTVSQEIFLNEWHLFCELYIDTDLIHWLKAESCQLSPCVSFAQLGSNILCIDAPVPGLSISSR